MPVSWDEHAQWSVDMVRTAEELGCSIEESHAVTDILMQFTGAPARVTKLATYCLEHMTELSEEMARDRKDREKN